MGNGTWVTVGVVAAAAGDVDGASGFTVCPPAAKKDDNSAPASVIVLVNIEIDSPSSRSSALMLLFCIKECGIQSRTRKE